MTKEETYLKIAGIDNIILNPKDLPEYWKHTAELLKEYSDTQLSEKDKELESYRSLLDDASEEVGKLNKEIERLKAEMRKAVSVLRMAALIDKSDICENTANEINSVLTPPTIETK